MKKSAQDREIEKLKKQVEKLKKEKESLQRDKRNLKGSAENGGYPPTQNGDIRSLFWLFSLMALQN